MFKKEQDKRYNMNEKPEKNSFYVKGNPKEVSQKLARLIDCSNPDNTGTGIKKELDMSQFSPKAIAKMGFDTKEISSAYTVNLIHRKRFASEPLMALLGQQTGMHAMVVGYKSRPNQSEVIPCYLEGPISLENMNKAKLELVE